MSDTVFLNPSSGYADRLKAAIAAFKKAVDEWDAKELARMEKENAAYKADFATYEAWNKDHDKRCAEYEALGWFAKCKARDPSLESNPHKAWLYWFPYHAANPFSETHHRLSLLLLPIEHNVPVTVEADIARHFIAP